MSGAGANVDFSHVTFISAGAGSGKTYRLTGDLEAALVGGVNPAGVIGTTFTVKAAGELKERVRERLIQGGRPRLAEQMTQALVGTVHSVCERLLKKFSFELGLSPKLNVISIEDGKRFFNQALDDVLDLRRVRDMNALARRLGQQSWQETVKAVADKVRENDLGNHSLAAMGKESADSLLQFFAPPVPRDQQDDLLENLKRRVGDALLAIDLSYDMTIGTRNYVRTLRSAAHQLRGVDCPWSVWIQLSAERATKKSDAIAALVREAAGRYEAHPDLHADIGHYIQSVLNIAAQTIARFQDLKAERGLIDFLDMERFTLRALDDDAVRARLDDELELLLVDEFQDTNPMQLAVFVKLATLADRVIFVGDVKQAIYAFRGCDPDLVFETLQGMATGNAATDILPSSWRSRPALVHYINEVFAAAFHGEIEREEVVLAPERDEQLDEPAVMSWTLAGDNREERVSALVKGVAELVASGHRIVDPDSGEPRRVRWGDIAVLARTNDHVEEIARALKDQRVPMKMTLAGLLSVPEICLAGACLRRLNDATDTLATAEIISLSDCAEPETWLADRLRWVAGEQPNYQWAQTSHPIIARLKALAGDSAMRSPVEIVARVLNDVGTRGIVTGWGSDAIKAAQRQRNLDAFLNLAVEYENHCESQYDAATLTGFLFWLENPSSPELDLQPVVTSGDAVHVLTYHRSKGLEWPVVIGTDFESEERMNLWDVRIDLTAGFDVEQPLANRLIRFWPNLFGRRTNNLGLRDRIIASDEAQQTARKNSAEQRRLAYVGMTRARDLLAVAHPARLTGGIWFDTFATDFTLPQTDELVLPDGEVIASAARILDGDGEAPDPQPFAPRWFTRRARRTDLPRELSHPSAAEPIEGAAVGEVVELGERTAIHGDDMTAIGSGLHAVIAAELVNPEQADSMERAEALLATHGVETCVAAADALAVARRFRAGVLRRFQPTRLYAEYPVTHALGDGRLTKGWIDVLLETDAGWVIIDHKSSPRPRSNWAREVAEYSGQLAAYGDAIKAAGKPLSGCWIHFAVSGGIVELVSPRLR